MYKSLYFSVIILIVLLTGCASKTTSSLVTVDKSSINEEKDLLRAIAKIKKIESRPSQAMIDSAPTLVKKAKKKQKLKKSAKPKKVLKEKKKTSLVSSSKSVKPSKPKLIVKTKTPSKSNTRANEISSVKKVKNTKKIILLKAKKEEELTPIQVDLKTPTKKKLPIPEVEKSSQKIEINNIKEESPETFRSIVSNKRPTKNNVAAKKENTANSISKELTIPKINKQNLEVVTSENEQKRVEEIISKISGIKQTDTKQIDPQNDLKEHNNARVAELIKQMSSSIEAPKVNLKKPESEKAKVEQLEVENLDAKSELFAQPQEIEKEELEPTDAKKNQRRIEEIISQISGVPIPNKEETKSKEEIEKQKNARIEELIAQMNGASRVLEEKTPSPSIVESSVILASNDLEVFPKKKLEPVILETKNREKTDIEKDLYKLKKKVGDKVCRDATELVNFLCMHFTAYVEDVKQDKIKVRIVDSQCENTKYNGIGLYKNTIIWDDHYHWKVCE